MLESLNCSCAAFILVEFKPTVVVYAGTTFVYKYNSLLLSLHRYSETVGAPPDYCERNLTKQK